MYDDILGPRRRKPDIDIGHCGECEFAIESTVHKSQRFIYCGRIKKYVHPSQTSCIRFNRKKTEFGI